MERPNQNPKFKSMFSEHCSPKYEPKKQQYTMASLIAIIKQVFIYFN